MKILVVEDEASIAERIQRMVAQITLPQKASVKTVSTFEAARAYINEHAIDLLLLDLNLNGKDGFDLLKEAVAYSFHTVIISAYEEKAIQAFEYGVLDFVPKPFTTVRLKKAIERFTEKAVTGTTAKYLAIKRSGRIELVDPLQVNYIKALGDYSQLNLINGAKIFHDKSLEHLQVLLQPLFYRIHKSYMVRVDAIARLHAGAGSRYEAELKGGVLLPIGRTRYKALKQLLLK